jgi:hypothetical protein
MYIMQDITPVRVAEPPLFLRYTCIAAKVDNECGTGQGNRSLHFSGADLRYAQTLPMDFSYGGVIKFQVLFLFLVHVSCSS